MIQYDEYSKANILSSSGLHVALELEIVILPVISHYGEHHPLVPREEHVI
jgi:hypothetical protein